MNREQFQSNLNIASFILGLMNYEENLTQNDKSEILQNSQNVSDKVIESIEQHLKIQDKNFKYKIIYKSKTNIFLFYQINIRMNH